MQTFLPLAMIALLTSCSNREVTFERVSIQGLPTCKAFGGTVSGYERPIQIKATNGNNRRSILVTGIPGPDGADAENVLMLPNGEPTTWKIKAGVCPNEMGSSTSYNCGKVTNWYHSQKFSYDPQKPTKITVPLAPGTGCI